MMSALAVAGSSPRAAAEAASRVAKPRLRISFILVLLSAPGLRPRAPSLNTPYFYSAGFSLFLPQFAQVLRLRHLALVGPVLVGAGNLQRGGQPLEARLGQECGEAVAAHLALADVRVAVAA